MVPVNKPLFEARLYQGLGQERLYRLYYDGHQLLFICIGGPRKFQPGGMIDLFMSIASELSKYISPDLPPRLEKKVLQWATGRDELFLQSLEGLTPQEMMQRAEGSRMLPLGQMGEVALENKGSEFRAGFHFANWYFTDNTGLRHRFMLETEENFCYAYQWLPLLFGPRLHMSEEMAAKAADPYFQYTIGFYFHHLQQRYDIARHWHTLAAARNIMPSMRQLGAYAEAGIGVAQNYEEAAQWYRKAADFGDMEAQLALAFLYEKGLGVEQDWPQAVYWAKLAAEQDLPEANFHLGRYCELGIGVPQDGEAALLWYRQSIKFGHPDGEAAVQRLETAMSREVKQP